MFSFEDRWSLYAMADDDIRMLELMMNILKHFVGSISNWQTEDNNLKYRLSSVTSDLEGVIQKYEASDIESLHLLGDAYQIVKSNLGMLRRMKPNMKQFCSVASMYSKPLTTREGTEVVRFINSLLHALNYILRFKTHLIILMKEQIEALQEKLFFLRNFLGFLSKTPIQSEFYLDLSRYAEDRAVDVAFVLYFILLHQMNGKQKELFPVVEKIVCDLEPSRSMITGPFVTGECALRFFDSLIHNFRELLNKEDISKVASNDQIEILLEGLRSVRCYIEETPLHNYKEGLDNFTTGLLDVVIDLGCFITFICSNDELESVEKLNDLLDKIQFIKSASGELLIPRSWQYEFPTTDELGFVDFILKNLKQQLDCNMVSADLWNCSVDIVYDELEALRHDFGETSVLRTENVELRKPFTDYKDVVYQAEYLFDLSLSAVEFSAYQRLGLSGLRESIRQIRSEIKCIKRKMASGNLIHNAAKSPGGVSSEANPALHPKEEAGSNTYKATDAVVGFEDDIEKIKGQLMRGSKQLNILSIVGMPGIGKTTLANSVYQDPAVTYHFHARAWCCVSQLYQTENLLLEILHQVRRETNQDSGTNNESIEQQLCKSLRGRKYLVILDDIWDTEVWNDLRLSFPDDSNGSRVLFTTRNHDVALHANPDPHALRLLSDEESWKLLRVKVFKKETCPAELLQVGKKMAEDCRGLPLAVDLIAGVLKTTERKQDCWEQVAKKLRSYVVDYASGQQSGTLELSYMHLPDYLKPCFLYFGAFPEDTEIPVRKLVRLWIAEGFVQPPKGNQISLEDEAEKYLNALIHRSLVMIAKTSSRGGVKACRIHDLLRDFCLVRAKNERFLLQINRYDEFPIFRISEMHEQYRLCIRSKGFLSVRMGQFESRVRTLFLSADFVHGIAVLIKFRLLRVLDLGNAKIQHKNEFVTISRLVYLRYLAVRALVREIPTEVANLRNLETFVVTGRAECVSPETFRGMANLRHLHGFKIPFNVIIDRPKFFEGLWRLETLSTTFLPCDKRTEEMMRNLPNLQKLKSNFVGSWDPLKNRSHFPVLDFLNRLESLKVFFSGTGLCLCNLSFPSSIKKLTLDGSCLPWKEISIIGRLPNLEVLKLLREAFTGPDWDMNDEEFQKLKFLKLVRLDIETWLANREHLPLLEQLVLEHCWNLKEIPSELGETPSLRRIDIKWCKALAMPSVEQIKERQHEMGKTQFNVFLSGD